MSNHTPGPWKFCGCGKCGILWGEVGSDPKWLGYLEEGDSEGVPQVVHRSEEWEANARLIAAAPEMLELLRSAFTIPWVGFLHDAGQLIARIEESGNVGAQ